MNTEQKKIFEQYLALGPERSLSQLAVQVGKSKSTLKKMVLPIRMDRTDREQETTVHRTPSQRERGRVRGGTGGRSREYQTS